ncbi:hypothetical protein EV702DRAFT_1279109 [Suillus placidus]|uniref:Uncharacterized protein n=1 Tax=Suillus placidus TaxID=48579 RepID=A0A9P6ZVA2_9AGAM|nr:hypothetical protein EV702DRAFT_1279109 [Suillus placidus]
MLFHGVLTNVKYDQHVLTLNGRKVCGAEFDMTDHQRWTAECGDVRDVTQVKLKNDVTGDYLAWDDSMNLVMRENGHLYLWNLKTIHAGLQSILAFQVPSPANTEDLYTLQLDDDQTTRYAPAGFLIRGVVVDPATNLPASPGMRWPAVVLPSASPPPLPPQALPHSQRGAQDLIGAAKGYMSRTGFKAGYYDVQEEPTMLYLPLIREIN